MFVFVELNEQSEVLFNQKTLYMDRIFHHCRLSDFACLIITILI